MPPSAIHPTYRRTFAGISAFCILSPPAHHVASLAFYTTARGPASRHVCYLHLFGGPMLRGWAGVAEGGTLGDALASAMAHLSPDNYPPDAQPHALAWIAALGQATGETPWAERLGAAGYRVLRAI